MMTVIVLLVAAIESNHKIQVSPKRAKERKNS